MMQYHYQNQQMCNTENCKRCPKKQGCLKYLLYLENIVSTPISNMSPALLNTTQTFSQSEDDKISLEQSSVDLSSVSELLSAYQNSTIELISNYSIDSANKFKSLLEINNRLIIELSEIKNTVIGLNEKISKLGSFIEMVEVHNAQNVASGNVDAGEKNENTLMVYNSDETLLKSGDIIQEKKRGLFGFGKEKDVTRIVK